METLFDLAIDIGVTIEYAPLNANNGEYRHELKRIRLRQGMAPRLERWTLAHELGHAVFGDEPSIFGPANAKMERRASEWAALRLIDVLTYREVEDLRDGHTASMAYDLGVTPTAVEVFRSMLDRVGDATYLSPRMGHGQFAGKLEAV